VVATTGVEEGPAPARPKSMGLIVVVGSRRGRPKEGRWVTGGWPPSGSRKVAVEELGQKSTSWRETSVPRVEAAAGHGAPSDEAAAGLLHTRWQRGAHTRASCVLTGAGGR
jgi:hypothetical protein